ncbi:type II secretion system protein [Caminibacter pacificus]|uniref:Prepilin-type N-terminal cleavage/methylation domain-containing protein n=1 Tax=Caminibacter pacificus TaxID=1424653 RepID=A0AAJ4RC45_9BACT|nr:type II secretion system protein [Caminibacter pacificus]QCI27966.1 type II secretion system protein [Caminibacter pacificus]ROR39850.1 prepilin-type N-terminal cleavage/methylation domain-containing protein [Caminibacter pacificus]
MRKAFTMIELIFVIVILGILAAVALPKFLGVAQQAHEGNLKSFVGTLNRTVAPTLWSKSISDGKDGNISYTDLEYYKGNDGNLTEYTDVPKEVKDMNLSFCDDPDNYKIVGWADKNVAGKNYFIACIGGNANHAPKFLLLRQTAPTNELTTAELGEANNSAITESTTSATFTGSGTTATGDILK